MKIILILSVTILTGVAAQAELSKDEAKTMGAKLWAEHQAAIRKERSAEMDSKVIQINEHTFRFESKKYGKKPDRGWDLFISMHGGGGTTAEMNDSQWKNQIRLGDAYKPKNAIYVAPRAPTDTWNLWHQGHIDELLDRLIENFLNLEDVNPNRVYLMGYSAGGDGVYQLAPRMADRLAGAAMMAGHPNDASPLGLRNIAFAIHVGEADRSYKRNTVAADWGKQLDALQKSDADGYANQVQVHKGKGHWMDLDDKVAVPWLQRFSRNPLPQKVIWRQDDVVHERFYWLALPPGSEKKGQLAVATIGGQTIRIEKTEEINTLLIRLNDDMLDLDHPVKVFASDGSELFAGKVARSEELAKHTLKTRGDQQLMFFGEIEISLEAEKGK